MMSYFRCGYLFITISYYPGANTGMKDVFPLTGQDGASTTLWLPLR